MYLCMRKLPEEKRELPEERGENIGVYQSSLFNSET